MIVRRQGVTKKLSRRVLVEYETVGPFASAISSFANTLRYYTKVSHAKKLLCSGAVPHQD